MMIFLMNFEMVRKVLDSTRQQSYLNLGRTGVLFVGLELLYNVFLSLHR